MFYFQGLALYDLAGHRVLETDNSAIDVAGLPIGIHTARIEEKYHIKKGENINKIMC